MHEKLGEFKEALHYFSLTMPENSDQEINYTKLNYDPYFEMGLCYLYLNEYKLAEKCFS